MKAVLISIYAIAITQARITPSTSLGRIVNGDDVKLGEIPHQVSLQTTHESFHFCGGSIINENYVITAAHCGFGNTASTIKIIAATVDLRNPTSTHAVQKIILHEQFNPYESRQHDIALIKVKTQFVISSFLNFATLPTLNQKIPANSLAVVSGWGTLWEDGFTPEVLQKTEIVIATQEYCENIYQPEYLDIYSTQICAYDPANKTGACHGDSGGPLTVDGILVGLVSGGKKCAPTKYPTVFTRMTEYIDWIEANAV